MALIKYGAGIVQMSGSIAGSVFARNRFGNYARPRTKPVNPHSTRQEGIRTIASYLAEYWHSVLTPTERNLWGVYAAAIAMKNKLGEQIFCTGFNHFMRSNAARLNMAFLPEEAAPTILSLPEKDALLAVSAESIAAQTFTFTFDTNGWIEVPEHKWVMPIYQGQPQLASRNFFNGPWRYMDYIDDAEGPTGTATLAASFAFALGQRVFFKSRIMTTSSRLSESWQIDSRIIEADA